MKFGVVTEVSVVITQVISGLKKLHILIFSKYKYLKIASLANVKSCVTVGPFIKMFGPVQSQQSLFKGNISTKSTFRLADAVNSMTSS